MHKINNDVLMPENLIALITLGDMHGVPNVYIAHEEYDNDDTAVYSLYDFTIIDGELTTREEEQLMSQWRRNNAEYLLSFWEKNEPAVIDSKNKLLAIISKLLLIHV